MKTLFLIAAMAASLGLVGTARAQDYSIDWFTVDSGGGTSTGGAYSISGSIGQADANLQPMTGEGFYLDGGFWSLFSVLPPGGLLLTSQSAGPDRATISWTPNSPGLVLQETLDLSPARWVDSPSGSANPITVTLDGQRKFFRAFRPQP